MANTTMPVTGINREYTVRRPLWDLPPLCDVRSPADTLVMRASTRHLQRAYHAVFWNTTDMEWSAHRVPW